MAKHNKVVSLSELDEPTVLGPEPELDEPLAVEQEVEYTNVRALVQLRYPVNVKARGQVSGKLYEWTSTGQIVEVDSADLDGVLSMKLGVSGCCGASKGSNQLFQLV